MAPDDFPNVTGSLGPVVRAVVLAAGAAHRFGGQKLLAPLAGRPVLQHVLDRLAAAGIDDPVVVLGAGAPRFEAAIAWRSAHRVVNPDSGAGLSSSLRIGWAAALAHGPAPDAVLVVLGDQPLLSPAVVRAVLAMDLDPVRPIVEPRYAASSARNPVRIELTAAALVESATGDRGLGPLLDARPELVRTIDVPGDNPDVDRPADLAAVAAADWADRVSRNAAQVERVREVPDGADFYGPLTALFRDDPDRTDDPVLDALRSVARPDDTWLDVGAGAGRYALPLARAVRQVIAVDQSPSMLGGLREGMADHAILNIRIVEGGWPDAASQLGPMPCADVTLIAHVGYDIAAIGPFVDALEAAARRTCVAVLMERTPAAVAEPFWPVVHGEARHVLPDLTIFTDLLRARGHSPTVELVPRQPRSFGSRDELLGFLRRQTWVAPDGDRDRRLQVQLDAWIVARPDGRFGLSTEVPSSVGIVTWLPRR